MRAFGEDVVAAIGSEHLRSDLARGLTLIAAHSHNKTCMVPMMSLYLHGLRAYRELAYNGVELAASSERHDALCHYRAADQLMRAFETCPAFARSLDAAGGALT